MVLHLQLKFVLLLALCGITVQNAEGVKLETLDDILISLGLNGIGPAPPADPCDYIMGIIFRQCILISSTSDFISAKKLQESSLSYALMCTLHYKFLIMMANFLANYTMFLVVLGFFALIFKWMSTKIWLLILENWLLRKIAMCLIYFFMFVTLFTSLLFVAEFISAGVTLDAVPVVSNQIKIGSNRMVDEEPLTPDLRFMDLMFPQTFKRVIFIPITKVGDDPILLLLLQLKVVTAITVISCCLFVNYFAAYMALKLIILDPFMHIVKGRSARSRP